MRRFSYLYLVGVLVVITLFSCNTQPKTKKSTMNKAKDGTYLFDKEFLEKYTKPVELTNGDASILVLPEYQGRVMTSTCNGDDGFSFGWINYDLIKQQKFVEHFNPFGGEERFWIGPEGGQFSVYFDKDKDFVFENWFVPEEIDTKPFDMVSQDENTVQFKKAMHLTNYSGTNFDFLVTRNVQLLSNEQVQRDLDISAANISVVAYKSSNTIRNTGEQAWKKETGLLSIWMLGMLIPSPEVTVVIPIKSGDAKLLGPKVNDDYFGKVSDSRLKVQGNKVFFKADGKSRGKIGIPPLRSTGIMGSYDAKNGALTILECKLPEGNTDYVNSTWELQENPYKGDALNSYNDGPLDDGSQMGPFYELETSSPALALKSGESYTHIQTTYHFQGAKEALNQISNKILGVSIDALENIL